MEKIVIPFRGSIADRLANAARCLALEAKDEEALEAVVAFQESSEILVCKEVPATDERLRDFLVRPGILRMAANSPNHQIVVYVAEGAPQDLWFQIYALATARAVQNLGTRSTWEPHVMDEAAVDLKTASAIAQFEALQFALRMFGEMGGVRHSDMVLFLREQCQNPRHLGDGSRALEFLSWCIAQHRAVEPHPDFRIQAAVLLRFGLVRMLMPARRLDEITVALSA